MNFIVNRLINSCIVLLFNTVEVNTEILLYIKMALNIDTDV